MISPPCTRAEGCHYIHMIHHLGSILTFQKLSYLQDCTHLVNNKDYAYTDEADYDNNGLDDPSRSFIGYFVPHARAYEVFEQRGSEGVEVT